MRLPAARELLVLALLVSALLALAIGSMWNDSATADEAAHIASGLLKLQDGRLDFYATQAPLVEAIEALPLALAGYRVPESATPYGNRPWVVGHILLYRSGYDAQTILRIARLPAIAMLLALCLSVFWFVRSVTGSDAAGLAAFTLTAFSPTLLAHGRLATVDIGLALFAFLAAITFWRLLEQPSTGRAIATGVWTACALTAKVSGAILVPYFLLLLLVHLARTRGTKRPIRDHLRALALAAAASLVVFVAIYLLLARSLDVTLPFRQHIAAIRAVAALYGDRYVLPQFLLGEFSHRGWPHYNFVAILVKTPVTELLLLVIALVTWRRSRSADALALVLFAALFLAVSAFSSLNLGIRHVLPVFPFLHAMIAIVLFHVWSRAGMRERRVVGPVLLVLFAAQLMVAVRTFPSYISYFNPLIGSHRNADRILIDSNLDWGQDLLRLRAWAQEREIERIRIHYFGAGSVEHQLGPLAIRWPAPRREPLPPGWFAVSRHFYRLSFLPQRSPIDYDSYLRASRAQFVTSIGGSIDVYRVP